MLATLAYVLFGVIEFIVGLRILLLLIGANPASPFVAWIYSWSGPLVAPFAGIFGQTVSTSPAPGIATPSIFDWTALIALVIYAIIGWILTRVLSPRVYHHGV